jgi:hypothetical protein
MWNTGEKGQLPGSMIELQRSCVLIRPKASTPPT